MTGSMSSLSPGARSWEEKPESSWRHDPDTTVGIDVTYISAEVMVRQTEDSTLVDGVPTLVVEILSPSDTD